jgi:protein-S-isoprenylcysteine O-methyltransferase Ste14
MKSITFWQIDMVPWYAFGAYWLITWLRVKPVKTKEPLAGRLATIVPLVFAFELLFSDWLRVGPLRMRFLPVDQWIAWSGVALTNVGAAIAIWARFCLGEYWSSRVSLKEGHRIIRSGPYAFVRHPIYTGMGLGVIGTAIVVGEWRGVLAIALVLAAHSRKALREEALLIQEFGAEYLAYRRSTGFLFPRIGGGAGMDTQAGHT